MKTKQRRDLQRIIRKLSELAPKLDELKDGLAFIIGDEQDAYETLSQSRHDGEHGDAMRAAIDSMQKVYDQLDNLWLEDLAKTLNLV